MNLIMPILQFLSKKKEKNAYLTVHKFILIQNLDNEISSCKGLDKKKDKKKKNSHEHPIVLSWNGQRYDNIYLCPIDRACCFYNCAS